MNKFLYLMLLNTLFSFGQINQFNYKRELKGIANQWHKIVLPDDIFGKTNNDLTDIRIYGVTKNDTIETPYIFQMSSDLVANKVVEFKNLNKAHNTNGYFFTFEIPTIESINQINLEFGQTNFDWRIKLEGSQNQNDWFTILDNYRILSITNNETNFQYTTLKFPDSKYRFFRLRIDAKEPPQLNSTSIEKNENTLGTLKNYRLRNFKVTQNKAFKQTEIEVDLSMPVKVSYLKMYVKDAIDYYRPLMVQYVMDSIKTQQGWSYNYQTLTSGTLNSVDKNEIKFNSTTTKKLKITILNQDNQPLNIEKIEVKGFVHELVARFTKNATYYLVYGNDTISKPIYDIERFADKVPTKLSILSLGNESKNQKTITPEPEPLFKNIIWLWLIMGLIVVVLGWFSIKMLRK